MVSADSNQPHLQRSSFPNTSSRAPRRVRGPLPWLFRLSAVAGACALAWGFVPRVLAQSSPPMFRARTELVRLDVSVTDKAGRPATDLRADEIEIAENGRRRPVV